MGGEKSINFYTILWFQGSPPHGRGKACQEAPRCAVTRITPAWAGKRIAALLLLSGCRDHPRMGGEKAGLLLPVVSQQGSPPHGRGKVAGAACRDLLGGITPALAGKSMTAPGRSSRTGDHPRVGGEKPAQQGVEPPCMGSPPHGRGKVRGRKPFLQEPWITPAWAGKRAQHAARDLPFQDHPRVGGEKRQKSPPRPARQGSPPHGRGKA